MNKTRQAVVMRLLIGPVLLIALAGCGGTAPPPPPGGDLQEVPGQVSLPAGAAVDLASLTVVGAHGSFPVASDGSFTALLPAGANAELAVIDADGELLLIGPSLDTTPAPLYDDPRFLSQHPAWNEIIGEKAFEQFLFDIAMPLLESFAFGGTSALDAKELKAFRSEFKAATDTHLASLGIFLKEGGSYAAAVKRYLDDLAAVFKDLKSAVRAVSWQATASPTLFYLSPEQAYFTKSQPSVALSVGTAGTMTGTFCYRWKTTGAYGYLSDGPTSGISFDTQYHSVSYIHGSPLNISDDQTVGSAKAPRPIGPST